MISSPSGWHGLHINDSSVRRSPYTKLHSSRACWACWVTQTSFQHQLGGEGGAERGDISYLSYASYLYINTSTFWFFGFHPIIYIYIFVLAFLYISSCCRNSDRGSHNGTSYLPSPLRYVPCMFIVKACSTLFPRLDSRRIVPVHDHVKNTYVSRWDIHIQMYEQEAGESIRISENEGSNWSAF